MGKRELVALLCLSSWSLVIVRCYELVCSVIVVFPDHTHVFLWQLLSLAENLCKFANNLDSDQTDIRNSFLEKVNFETSSQMTKKDSK